MNTTLTQNKASSIGWLVGWAVASAIGLVVGLMGTLMLLWSSTENFTLGLGEQADAVLFGTIFGLGLGLMLGIAQWIVLRLRGESNLRWVGATIVGGVIGGVVALFFGNTFNPGGENAVLNVLMFALLGGIIGAAQLLLARGVAKSVLWIAASALALSVGGVIAFQFSDFGWTAALGGAAYGIITAAALWWLGRE